MHEYSVVQALIEQIETIAAQNQARKVTRIIVKIGVMSGIEPHLLEIAFNTFKEKTICAGAEFVMNIQAVTIQCLDCKKRSELEPIRYCCPQCESLNIKVIDGEDLYLMRLEIK